MLSTRPVRSARPAFPESVSPSRMVYHSLSLISTTNLGPDIPTPTALTTSGATTHAGQGLPAASPAAGQQVDHVHEAVLLVSGARVSYKAVGDTALDRPHEAGHAILLY